MPRPHWLFVVSVTSLLACSDPGPEWCGPQEAEINLSPTDEGPAHFSARLLRPDGHLDLHCPHSPTPDGWGCLDTGFFWETTSPELRLVLKSRGWQHQQVQQTLAFAAAPARTCSGQVQRAQLTLTMQPLEPFIDHAAYATGFSPEGKARFAELALSVASLHGQTQVVKFLIEDVDTAPRVYFQDTRAYPLHYAFWRGALGRSGSQEAFNQLTYHGEDRVNLAGTLLWEPARVFESSHGPLAEPLVLTFFPGDDLTPSQVLRAYTLLEERLLFLTPQGQGQRLVYVPATEHHQRALEEEAEAFWARDALWMRRESYHGDTQVQYLNPGKGCGTLHYLSGDALARTPLSFRDLVVLDRLPNTLPLVGGTITEELQTPLAHVNVAARSRGTPNLALLGAATDPRVAPFIGRLVCLEVERGAFALYEVDMETAEAFWATLIPPNPVVPPADLSPSPLLDFAALSFADARRVGVKAANLAELSRLLPEVAPQGFAVPFSDYHHFMSETLVTPGACWDALNHCVYDGRAVDLCRAAEGLCRAGDGLSLRDYLAALLDNDDFARNTALREATLAGLRRMMIAAPTPPALAAALDAEVARRWGSRKVRLRSSSNAEDLEHFSGAGLYSSQGAALETGKPPSVQVRAVWASTWNFGAFEERAFWNVDHLGVQMGVAVHPSYRDEAANGVLITQSIVNPDVQGFYVNIQRGEHAVTNPEGGMLPEVLTLVPTAGGVAVLRDRFSSMSPQQPLLSDAELENLFRQARRVHTHFVQLYGRDPGTFALELEFKVLGESRSLAIKQARPFYAAP